MGYKKQWIPKDRTRGEVSVSELQKKLASDQEAINKWAESTWDEPNTLTGSQIATLDGTSRLQKKGEFNAIGQPVSLQSGNNPRGFSHGEVNGEEN